MNAITQPDHGALRHISDWLVKLSDICSAGREPLSAPKMATYATVLAQWLPLRAFTSQSLAEAARGKVFFPSAEEIRERVAAWWSDHKPADVALLENTQGKPPGWTDMEDAWLRYFYTRRDEAFGPHVVGDQNWPRGSREVVLSLIKAQSPLAYEHLMDAGV